MVPALARLLRPALLLALLAGVPGLVAAQSTPPDAVSEALGHIQAQGYAEAARVLERVVESQPANARAWSLLGFAYHSMGELEKAIPAHRKATEFEQTRPAAMYNLGLAYALSGETDRAFEWLFRAKETGRINMTDLGTDPDSESLRDDPRFRELFPSEEEFADPFAEPVEILREWRGEAAGDQFGWIARNIGDVDGDGIADVTTSAPTRGENAGRVYVFSSGTGERLWHHDGEAGERLGLGIEAAGDVNADGTPDVVAGAPGGDRALVFDGRDGTVIREIEARQPGELFARKVGDVGDVDGDGHDDLLIGAPQNDAAGEDAGRAYLFSGRTGEVLLALTGEEAGDRFGASAGGEVRDGEVLFMVGAPGAGPSDRGRTYVYRGLTAEPAFVVEADDTGFQLGGMFVSAVGDVDRDGTVDVYASDWPNQAKGRSTGRAYVHSGATGERLYTMTGEAAGDGFGIGTADAGDVDGDGYDDLVIGAWQHAGLAPSGGKVYVYSGRDGSLLREITSKVPGETFGFDATGMGDVDGDGTPDFLLTSAWSAVEGSRSGRMFIVSGAPPESGR